jgi:hypothetical protein
LSEGYFVLIVVTTMMVWAWGAYSTIRRPMRINALPLAPDERVLLPHPEFTLAHQVFLTSERLLWVQVPLDASRLPAFPLLLIGRLISRRDPVLSRNTFELRLTDLDSVEAESRVAPDSQRTTGSLRVRSGPTNVSIYFTSRQNSPEAWKSAIDQQLRTRR